MSILYHKKVRLHFGMLTCMQAAVRKLQEGEKRKTLIAQVRAVCDNLGVELPSNLNALLQSVVEVEATESASARGGANGEED